MDSYLDRNKEECFLSLSLEGSLERVWTNKPPRVDIQAANTVAITSNHSEAELNMYALLPDPLASRSPSSRGTTPDPMQETMLRIPTPTPTASPGDAVPSAASASHLCDSPPLVSQPCTSQSSTVQALTSPSPTPSLPAPLPSTTTITILSICTASPQPSTSQLLVAGPSDALCTNPAQTSSEEFRYFLDTMEQELKLCKDVKAKGGRKIDVLLHDGHEFRCDRPEMRKKANQTWVCRHAHAYKCKSKFRLNVTDLADPANGSTMSDFINHNHRPYHMESYGLANISVLSVNQSTDEQHENALNLPGFDSDHRLNSAEFSGDFNPEVMEDRIRSTPLEAHNEDDRNPFASLGPIALNVGNLTDSVVDTSQKDVRGFTIRKFKRRQRTATTSDAATGDFARTPTE